MIKKKNTSVTFSHRKLKKGKSDLPAAVKVKIGLYSTSENKS